MYGRSSAVDPPGVAYRVYERKDSGRHVFAGIAIHLGGMADVTLFRWAASTTVRKIETRIWDGWKKEVVPNFRISLRPKEG